ncbi:Ion channel [Necator americanus]|uniref:Ion channel n=1 Tax=Necator americanus TaxID=51031 RepID=W2SXT0_NECAM|nr:Ion channel [Necator americanus]ETN74440.1 Ion channel [Necator americanus]
MIRFHEGEGESALEHDFPRTISSSQPEPPKTCMERFRTLYKRYHIKHLFPLFFIMFYMGIGSVIFYLLESSTDQSAKNEQYQTYMSLKKDFSYSNNVFSRERELLRRRMDEILSDRAAGRREVSNESQWSLMSAMYYSGTLFTTIGYGDIACVTVAGRILTVIYSCIGIPLMLITLNDLGKFLYNNINGCVKNIEDFGAYLGVFRVCAKRIQKADEVDMVERGETHTGEISSLASEIGSLPSIGDIEEPGEPKLPRMSVKVALGITISWIFFCSALFGLWEDWTYAESCYFMYISLSTIGLGDISHDGALFVFVIVGLSLVSMSINVVQVALEDFYINLMMKIIIEYQEKMAAGGDQMGASVGMMRMWGGNKTAKYLMPLLSKEKKRVAMEKVEQEAQSKGLEIPPILTDLDDKTGKCFYDKTKNFLGCRNCSILSTVMRTNRPRLNWNRWYKSRYYSEINLTVMLEEANEIPIFLAHETACQTDTLETSDKMEQTVDKVVEDTSCQTEEGKVSSQESETQTEAKDGYNVETQTFSVETVDKEVLTTLSPLLDALCQTESSVTMDQISQTNQADQVDVETSTELETKSVRIQTPCPIIEHKTIQTEDLEDRKSPSKMSSAKKRIRRAFAKSKPTRSAVTDTPSMSEWKDVSEEENATPEEELSEESLHWDPVDGMHAEKQLPVATLASMFDRNVTPDRAKRQLFYTTEEFFIKFSRTHFKVI